MPNALPVATIPVDAGLALASKFASYIPVAWLNFWYKLI